MIFFTSDTHFNDDRFEINFRPFKSVETQNNTIIKNWNSTVGKKDVVYHLGDFSVDPDGYSIVQKLNGEIHLIMGNYDHDNLDLYNHQLFKSVNESAIVDLDDLHLFLTHKPENARMDMFNLVGHVHSLWKVQRNMINVSTDVWNFLPVSEKQIKIAYEAIQKYYDKNVFIGEYTSPRAILGQKVMDLYKGKLK